MSLISMALLAAVLTAVLLFTGSLDLIGESGSVTFVLLLLGGGFCICMPIVVANEYRLCRQQLLITNKRIVIREESGKTFWYCKEDIVQCRIRRKCKVWCSLKLTCREVSRAGLNVRNRRFIPWLEGPETVEYLIRLLPPKDVRGKDEA